MKAGNTTIGSICEDILYGLGALLIIRSLSALLL